MDATSSVPLSTAGNARISERLDVPARCIAPVVLLNPNGITSVFIDINGRQR